MSAPMQVIINSTRQQYGGVNVISTFVNNIKDGIIEYLTQNRDKINIDKAQKFFLFYYYFHNLPGNRRQDVNSVIQTFVSIFASSKQIDSDTLKNICKGIVDYYDGNKNVINNCINTCIENALKASKKHMELCFETEDRFKGLMELIDDINEKCQKIILYNSFKTRAYTSLNDNEKNKIPQSQYDRIKTTLNQIGLRNRVTKFTTEWQTDIKKINQELNQELNQNEVVKYKNLPYSPHQFTRKTANVCTLLNDINKYKLAVVDLQEDIEGLVRVYIKIRPSSSFKSTIEILENEKLSVFCGGKTSKSFGSFYGIFDDTNIKLILGDIKHITDKNLNLAYQAIVSNTDKSLNYNKTDYSPFNIIDDNIKQSLNGLFKSFDQARRGYSIVIFGYGLSGSGKTYSLIGEQDTKNENAYHQGTIIQGLEYLFQQGCHIEIDEIFEQCNDETLRSVNMYTNDEKRKITERLAFLKQEQTRLMAFNRNSKVPPRLNNTSYEYDILNKYISKSIDEFNDIIKNYFSVSDEKDNSFFIRSNLLMQDIRNITQNPKYKAIPKITGSAQNTHLPINMLFCKLYSYYSKNGIDNLKTKFNISNYIILEEIKIELDDINLYNDNVFSKQKLIQILVKINEYRKKNKRIKATPNNTQSSRSHLYIVFKISDIAENITGYITMVDMGGRENAYEIANKYTESTIERTVKYGAISTIKTSKFKQTFEKMFGNYDIDEAIKIYNIIKNKLYIEFEKELTDLGNDGTLIESERNTKTKVLQEMIDTSYLELKTIIEEGMFINETINHLIHFFEKKIYNESKNKSLDNIVDIIDSYKDDSISYKTLYDLNEQDKNKMEYKFARNVGMLPILEWLDTGLVKNQDKPTKFICLMCIRQEPEKCEETMKTLEFANKIKST